MGWDSAVGIETSLRAGRSGDQIPLEQDFSHSSRPALRSIQPPNQWVRVFTGCGGGVKAAGAWR